MSQDPEILAIIIGGSLTKGLGQENSDIDGLMVFTDEAFARYQAQGKHFFITKEYCDYQGVYMDAKGANLEFLSEVADYGSEPACLASIGAFVACSSTSRCTPKPSRMSRFVAQIEAARWYVREGRSTPTLT